MVQKNYSNVIGFDDTPFQRDHKGNVKIVGTIYASQRFDGLLIGEVEKDGFDSTDKLIQLISNSKYYEHIQLIMLQGISFGGFNVVDVFHLNKELDLPVLVVARKKPDLKSIKTALVTNIQAGQQKWEIIKKLGPMELIENIYIQRVGLSLEQTCNIIRQFAVNGNIPEPIRTAHLIAGALGSTAL